MWKPEVWGKKSDSMCRRSLPVGHPLHPSEDFWLLGMRKCLSPCTGVSPSKCYGATEARTSIITGTRPSCSMDQAQEGGLDFPGATAIPISLPGLIQPSLRSISCLFHSLCLAYLFQGASHHSHAHLEVALAFCWHKPLPRWS